MSRLLLDGARAGARDRARTCTAGRHRYALAAALLLVATALAAMVSVLGCIEQEKVKCAGGTYVGDKCYPICEPDKCLDGNICVDHLCRLVCTSHADCDWPWQECRPPVDAVQLQGDAVLVDRARIFGVCQEVGRIFVGSTYGTPCPYGNECWASACPNGMECDLFACDDGSGPRPDLCKPDPVACAGKDPCNIGICENTGVACAVTLCPDNECTPFACLSAGVGDTTAYCTHHDCQSDLDCPGGYYCGVTRDPHAICGPTCQGGSCSDDGSSCVTDGDCLKGNSRLCGETEEPCIPPEQFNTDGKQMFEGSLCLLRRSCLKREPCVPCEHNLDCSLDPELVCLDLAGQKNCVRFCSEHSDCAGDEICSPSYPTCEYTSTLGCGAPGPDSPDCPSFPCVAGQCATLDGQPGAACTTAAECPRQACSERWICMPRTGNCRGTGGFCEHCIDDTDCGGPETRRACEEVTDGEFACFDFTFPDTCPSGSDSECPQAPSGAYGECLNEAENVSPSDSVYHHCYFPFSAARQSFTCWPSPP